MLVDQNAHLLTLNEISKETYPCWNLTWHLEGEKDLLAFLMNCQLNKIYTQLDFSIGSVKNFKAETGFEISDWLMG